MSSVSSHASTQNRKVQLAVIMCGVLSCHHWAAEGFTCDSSIRESWTLTAYPASIFPCPSSRRNKYPQYVLGPVKTPPMIFVERGVGTTSGSTRPTHASLICRGASPEGVAMILMATISIFHAARSGRVRLPDARRGHGRLPRSCKLPKEAQTSSPAHET